MPKLFSADEEAKARARAVAADDDKDNVETFTARTQEVQFEFTERVMNIMMMPSPLGRNGEVPGQ